MINAEDFDRQVDEIIAEEIEASRRHNAELPACQRELAYLRNLTVALQSSAEVLSAFTGVSGLAYSYRLPAKRSQVSVAMDCMYVDPLYREDANRQLMRRWGTAHFVFVQELHEARREGQVETLIERHSSNLVRAINAENNWAIRLMAGIEIINPHAGLNSIQYERQHFREFFSVMMGICSRFHPDDIKHAVENRLWDPPYRPDEIGGAVFDWVEKFGLYNRYTISPATSQKLEHGLREQGLPLDPSALIPELENRLEQNLAHMPAPALAVIYLTSRIGIKAQIQAVHDAVEQGKELPQPAAGEIKSINRRLSAFQDAMFRAARKANLTEGMARELGHIVSFMRRFHVPEHICNRVTEEWQHDLHRTGEQPPAVAAGSPNRARQSPGLKAPVA